MDEVGVTRADAVAPVEAAREDYFAYRRMRRFAKSWLGQRIVATRGARRIPDLESLRQRLRCPEVILCVGNGPSSEDPAVLDVAHDCLMRVNHRWLERGVLTRPDMVFVGDLSTTLVLPPSVFGFRVIAKEHEVLLRHLLFGFRLAQIEHFTLERVPSVLDTLALPANPTNGALMVATAALLQPRRIVIAGVDLYADPRGRYPGGSTIQNAYPPANARAVDLAFMERALSAYRGEVQVLSPSLDRALHERRAS